MLLAMEPLVGWITIAVAVLFILGTWFGLRGKAPPRMLDVGSALGGVGLAVGGLLLIEDPGVPSWIVTPLGLALATVVHRRLLFAGDGPLRT
jgi:hypothetical protein